LWVDLEQELALADDLAFLDRQLDDLARDIGAQIDLGLWAHLPARRDRGHEITRLHLLGTHLDCLVLAFRGGQPADRDDDEDHPACHGPFHSLAHVQSLGG